MLTISFSYVTDHKRFNHLIHGLSLLSALTHFRNQCCSLELIFYYIIIKIQVLIHDDMFENIVCSIVAILRWPQCVHHNDYSGNWDSTKP